MKNNTLLDSRNGRLATFGLLYISEGIPFGFTSIAMVTFMRSAGISLEQIGVFVAILFIPWSFKFAWAPLIDLIKLNRFGGRKAWIMGCLLMMILTLVAVITIDFKEQFELLLWLMLLNNIFCASQDVAIDSLAVSTLKPDERASGNGFMFGGMYTGIALGGGAAVYIYGLTSFETAVMYVTALQVFCLLFVMLFVYDPRAKELIKTIYGSLIMRIVRTLSNFIKEVYVSFWRSGPAPKIGFLFSVLPIGSMVLGYAALSTIQVDYGFSENEIAQITTLNTIAGAIGCVVGGLLADRYGVRKMLGIYFLLTAIPGLVLAVNITSVGLNAVPAMIVASSLVAHGFFFGMAFGTHAAVFMSITNPAVAATQFTAFMAMGNLAISYTNYWQGIVAENFDYATVLYIDALLILPGLAVIPFLQSREKSLQIAAAMEAEAAANATA